MPSQLVFSCGIQRCYLILQGPFCGNGYSRTCSFPIVQVGPTPLISSHNSSVFQTTKWRHNGCSFTKHLFCFVSPSFNSRNHRPLLVRYKCMRWTVSWGIYHTVQPVVHVGVRYVVFPLFPHYCFVFVYLESQEFCRGISVQVENSFLAYGDIGKLTKNSW